MRDKPRNTLRKREKTATKTLNAELEDIIYEGVKRRLRAGQRPPNGKERKAEYRLIKPTDDCRGAGELTWA